MQQSRRITGRRLCCFWQKKKAAPLIKERGFETCHDALPTQRYNDANPPLLWRGCSHYLQAMLEGRSDEPQYD
jgi:hypothetical protein